MNSKEICLVREVRDPEIFPEIIEVCGLTIVPAAINEPDSLQPIILVVVADPVPLANVIFPRWCVLVSSDQFHDRSWWNYGETFRAGSFTKV